MEENKLIIDKLVIDNYKVTLNKDKTTIPTFREIKEQTLYNFSAKCYDIIYDIDISFLSDEIIKTTLTNNRLMFLCEGELINCTQVSLF